MSAASWESCSSLPVGSFHSIPWSPQTALPHPPCLSVPFDREEIHRQIPPQEHSWISQLRHSLWMLSLEFTFFIIRKKDDPSTGICLNSDVFCSGLRMYETISSSCSYYHIHICTSLNLCWMQKCLLIEWALLFSVSLQSHPSRTLSII